MIHELLRIQNLSNTRTNFCIRDTKFISEKFLQQNFSIVKIPKKKKFCYFK